MELLYLDGSPFARITRVLAREWGVPVTETELPFPLPERHFDIAPLGQVPVLVEDGTALFPTAIIIDRLADHAGHTIRDPQALATTLAWGDALVAAFYQTWAGLGPATRNTLGFDPATRNLSRTDPFLDWIAPRLSESKPDAAEFALACILDWTDSRHPIPWQGRPPVDALMAQLAAHPSLTETTPRPWDFG